MAKLTLEDITSGLASTTTTNANNALVEAAVENTLSRDGTVPNQMEAELDMNSYRIRNLPNAVSNAEPVTLGQANTLAGVENPLTQDSVGAVLYPRTAAEVSASVTPSDYSYPPGNVLRYGADASGAVDSSQAITNALLSNDHVWFPDGTYLIESAVTRLGNNTSVDFGNAVIRNGGVQFPFVFGSTSDTPIYEGLRITGGNFEQVDASTTENRNYIRIAGTSSIYIADVSMKNISNGGLYIEAGCEDGVVTGLTIEGETAYSTIRGIWLDGSSASDYLSQAIDISTLERNATDLPLYAAKDIKITDCTIDSAGYGVYMINTRNCKVCNNYIDISGSGLRCVAVNNYSPGSIVSGNTLIGDQSSTGVIVTQFSQQVIVSNNVFLGTFGGGRDVYVQYMGDALITGNHFFTSSTQNILVDSNGKAVIRGNTFARPDGYSANTRVCEITNIDAAVAGTSTYGDTATVLQGIIFENNIVNDRLVPVRCRALSSTAGNFPGFEYVIVRNNIFNDFDGGNASEEFGFRVNASGSTYPINYIYKDNTVLPTSEDSVHNVASIIGSGFNDLLEDIAPTQSYTETNVSPDRAFDADTVAVAELADVVGTLITDLRAKGLVQ